MSLITRDSENFSTGSPGSAFTAASMEDTQSVMLLSTASQI